MYVSFIIVKALTPYNAFIFKKGNPCANQYKPIFTIFLGDINAFTN